MKDISKLSVGEGVVNFDGFDAVHESLQSRIDEVIKRFYMVSEQLAQRLIVLVLGEFHHHLLLRLPPSTVSPQSAFPPSFSTG